MSFTRGTFDIVAQVETSALDVVVDVLLERLKAQGKTTFTQTIGSGGAISGQVDVELTDLSIPAIRSLDMNDRFKPGNTLASFRIDAELKVGVTVFGLPGRLTETLFVALKDLAFGIYTTPGGLPVGIALGFREIDLDAGGLSTLRVLNPALDVLADFISLGIRTALTPLGLIPIPVLQFADAFAKLGLSFDPPSPHLGTNQAGDGLYVAADFAAAGNSSDIGVVTDLIPSGSPLNVGTVLSDRPINQVLAFLLASNQLPRSIPTAGARFGVREVKVAFLDRGARTSKVQVDAAASARVRSRKGGFFGKLFGKKKKVTIRAYAQLKVDTSVIDDPITGLAIIDFQFEATLRARTTIQSVLVGALTVLLPPFLVPFFMLLSQLLNFAADYFLPFSFKLDAGGGELRLRLEQLDTELRLASPSFSAATLKMRLDARGSGQFELDQFTQHQILQTGVPLKVDYTPDSLESRASELYLAAGLDRQ